MFEHFPLKNMNYFEDMDPERRNNYMNAFSFRGMLSIVYFSTQVITVTTKGANHRVLVKGGDITHEIYNPKISFFVK